MIVSNFSLLGTAAGGHCVIHNSTLMVSIINLQFTLIRNVFIRAAHPDEEKDCMHPLHKEKEVCRHPLSEEEEDD